MTKLLSSRVVLTCCFAIALLQANHVLAVKNVKASFFNYVGDAGISWMSHQLMATSDTTLILKQCLDLPAIQQYFTKNADGTGKQVYIMQHNTIFPADMLLSKFDQAVVFKSRAKIYGTGVENFLIFTDFSIQKNDAKIVFDLNYSVGTTPKIIQVSLNLHKNAAKWEVTNTQLRQL